MVNKGYFLSCLINHGIDRTVGCEYFLESLPPCNRRYAHRFASIFVAFLYYLPTKQKLCLHVGTLSLNKSERSPPLKKTNADVKVLKGLNHTMRVIIGFAIKVLCEIFE